MLIEKIEQNTYRNHIQFLFAWVQNPSCTRIKQNLLQFPTSESNWKPRQRFIDWALQQENLKQGFADYLTNVQSSIEKQQKLEGQYTRNPILSFSTPFTTLSISPDATIIHNDQEKVMEVCCHPERKGNTSRFALQKSRLRAAIHSFALNPEAPCSSAFIILHRWNRLVVHEQNIEQELQQIHEAMNTKYQDPYHFIPSCHWFCPYSEQCQEKAQEEGAPVAWSLSLQNIVHNVWSAKKELSQTNSSPLSIIAHFYKKSFSEET
tara:strand:+ start:424 stop:1215 length:792 start_codon:yes stop_codon:yes gene_type:complete